MPRTATRRYNESRNAPTVIVFSPLRFDRSFFSSFLFSLPSPFEIQRNSIRSNVWQYNIREKERNVPTFLLVIVATDTLLRAVANG